MHELIVLKTFKIGGGVRNLVGSARGIAHDTSEIHEAFEKTACEIADQIANFSLQVSALNDKSINPNFKKPERMGDRPFSRKNVLQKGSKPHVFRFYVAFTFIVLYILFSKNTGRILLSFLIPV